MVQYSQPADPAILKAKLEASPMWEGAPRPSPIVTTSRLIIRAYHLQDAPSMALHANSAAVAKNLTNRFPQPYTLESAETWIEFCASAPVQTDFCICEASSPEVVIGSIGLKLGTDVESHTAELGFWINEKFWGRGYVTEALAAFTKWSFESWEGKDGQRLRRLWGRAFSGNNASMRCFEKCGYAKEGVLRGHAEKHGKVLDQHIFGLPKTDWEARK